MFGKLSPSDFELTARDKRLLADTAIDTHRPGPILHDFDVLLNYALTQKPDVTTKRQLPLKALAPINEELSRPLQHGLKRPQQKSFPHVNGLYLLLRASSLTRIDTSAKKPKLVPDQRVLQSWQSLNDTEKYFTLLESWLLRGSNEILGERGRFSGMHNPLYRWLSFFSTLPKSGLEVGDNRERIERLRYTPELHNLALLALFGYVTIEHGAPVSGEGWQIDTVRATPLGWAMLRLLRETFIEDVAFWHMLNEPARTRPGELQPLLRPYFPEWQNNLQWPEHSFRDGMYILRVTLLKFEDVWRRIAAPATVTLESLGSAILNAFKFDHDHLDRFIYPSRIGLTEEVNHPYMDEGPFTSEVKVGDVPLQVGDTMVYNFDFGDNWLFDVKLEAIEAADPRLKKPKLLESHGKAPEQYPSYGDEW